MLANNKFSNNPPTPPVGVIESLTQGFEVVAGHLFLLILPLLLDAALWLGPRVSFAPVIESLTEEYYHAFWQPLAVTTDPEIEQSWDDFVNLFAYALGGKHVQYFPFSPFLNLPMLSMPDLPAIPMIGVPSLMTDREAHALPFDYEPPVWKIRSLGGLVGIRLAGLLGGFIFGCVYLFLITGEIKDNPENEQWSFSRIVFILLQFFAFGIIMPLLLAMILLPFGILTLGLVPFNAGLAGLAALFGRVLVLWLGIFVAFTVQGMLLHNRNVLGAIWDSIRVVQWNMSPTMFLILLILLLSWALGFVWKLVDDSSWLALIAIAGHAFISTGLTATLFIYYKDRYRYWHEARERLLTELENRVKAKNEQ